MKNAEGCVDIAADRRDKFIDRGKLHFTAQLLDKCKFQLRSVEIAVKAGNMRLHGARHVAEGGIAADVFLVIGNIYPNASSSISAIPIGKNRQIV